MTSRRKPYTMIPYEDSGSIPWELPWDSQPVWNPHTESFDPDRRYDWKPAQAFMARLRFHRMEPRNKGATFYMQNEDTGAEYPMRLQDFTALIPSLVYGSTPVESWEPFKNGNYYYIRLYDDKEEG